MSGVSVSGDSSFDVMMCSVLVGLCMVCVMDDLR